MRTVLRFVLLLSTMAVLLSSGWVCYSDDQECPWPPKPVGQEDFFSAHGITQENYSIWLQEHSAWRREYSDELKAFTFIPQDHDPHRR